MRHVNPGSLCLILGMECIEKALYTALLKHKKALISLTAFTFATFLGMFMGHTDRYQFSGRHPILGCHKKYF